MARSILAVLCTLLAALASPVGTMDAGIDVLFGAGCCGVSCCCEAAAACNVGEPAMPKLVSACKCAHGDSDTAHAAPQVPRVCSGEPTVLSEPQPRAVVAGDAARAADDRRPVPELPPPRARDAVQASA